MQYYNLRSQSSEKRGFHGIIVGVMVGFTNFYWSCYNPDRSFNISPASIFCGNKISSIKIVELPIGQLKSNGTHVFSRILWFIQIRQIRKMVPFICPHTCPHMTVYSYIPDLKTWIFFFFINHFKLCIPAGYESFHNSIIFPHVPFKEFFVIFHFIVFQWHRKIVIRPATIDQFLIRNILPDLCYPCQFKCTRFR